MTEKPPTPAEIDRIAKQYLAKKDELLQAQLGVRDLQQQMGIQEELLKKHVAAFGSSHAEKSKILPGLEYEAMCTYGQISSIDAAAVETFRQALGEAKQARLISKIFEKTIRWTLRSEASVILRRCDLSNKLQSLWAKCIVLKDKTPSLQVRLREKQ